MFCFCKLLLLPHSPTKNVWQVLLVRRGAQATVATNPQRTNPQRTNPEKPRKA